MVKNLVAGTYQFELKVTDNSGLIARDTIQITVNSAGQLNRPPVANAGPDQIITLPTNSVTLDGTASTDPDNNISNYVWTKISGPSAFNIVNINTVQTQVNNLVEGVYQFELKVTDAGGLYSKDTMKVNVNPAAVVPACDNSNRPQLSAQLIPVGILSQARHGMALATSGNKILFAGGTVPGGGLARVDIYDITTQSWSTAELCVGRYAIATVAAGNKIFFGGGEYSDGTWPVDSVDIYDVSTNTWTVSHLSTAGNSIAAAAVGNKVLFAGGDGGFPGVSRETRVDIYDLNTGSWSTASLSERKRGEHSAVTIGNKIYFAGGETWNLNNNYYYASNKVDIYDNATNTWTTSSMQEGKLNFASIAYGGKIYWAGGGQNAVVKDNKIIFLRLHETDDRNKFDVYDMITNTWSIGVLPQSIPREASVISVNNTIYVAGGYINGTASNQVWKLEF
jgi:N-acetylneuraminic acid mutarotase